MILVTGATGFIGSHLLHELARLERPVRALYHNRDRIGRVREIFHCYPEDSGKLMDKIEFVEGDVLDYSSLVGQLKGIHQVYHCAGLVSFRKADVMKMTGINVKGTAHVVNACLEQQVPRLCHVSSISALGDSPDGGLIDETSLWNQESYSSPYAQSKYRSEMEVWRGIYEGMNAVIINPSVVIGPGSREGSIPEVMDRIKRGLKYYPTGATGFVDVRDVAMAMIQLTDSDIQGERFIVSAENRTLREIIGYLAEALQVPAPDRPLTPGLIRMACIFEKFRSIVTGKPARVNATSMKSATAVTAYSNRKLQNTLPVTFIPVRDSVNAAVQNYREGMEISGKK